MRIMPKHRSRAIALSTILALVAACGLGACSSAEVSTGGAADGGPAGVGTAPPDHDQTTTTEVTDSEGGEDGDDDGAQQYVDALVSSFSPEGQEPFTQESVACLAPRWVEAIGVQTFEDAGVTPEGLGDDGGVLSSLPITEPVAQQMVGAIVDCGVPLVSFAIEALPSSLRDDPDAVACVEDTVAEAEVRSKLVEAMSSDGPDGSPRDLVEQCILEHQPPLPPASSTSVP